MVRHVQDRKTLCEAIDIFLESNRASIGGSFGDPRVQLLRRQAREQVPVRLDDGSWLVVLDALGDCSATLEFPDATVILEAEVPWLRSVVPQDQFAPEAS
jgi:hypothetical protein